MTNRTQGYGREVSDILLAFVAIGTSAVSFLLLRFVPAPFIWILFLWFAFFMYGAAKARNTAQKFILVNIGIVILALGVYEAYLWIAKEPEPPREYPKGIVTRHPLLGYTPRENSVAAHLRVHEGEVVFDVVYTTDSTGLRVAPPYDQKGSGKSILFFGGSFTYGSGVEDEQTMPYLTGVKAEGRYHIYNFSFRGYGAHQMLAAVEHGIVESTITEGPAYVIYQGIADHVPRAAGLKKWSDRDPRYVLNQDGKAVYKGSFDEAGGRVYQAARSELTKSEIVKVLRRAHWNRHAYDEANMELFAAIVAASRDIIESQYPDCEFHVILWDSGKTDRGGIAGQLERHGIRLHYIADILPNRSREPLKYKISQTDSHPSALANELIAEYVVSEIISRE